MNSNAEEPYGVLERMIRSSILWLKTDNRVPLPLTLLLACSFGYTSNVVQLYILNFRRQFCWKKFYGILMTTVIYVVSTFHFNYSSIPILPSLPTILSNLTFQCLHSHDLWSGCVFTSNQMCSIHYAKFTYITDHQT